MPNSIQPIQTGTPFGSHPHFIQKPGLPARLFSWLIFLSLAACQPGAASSGNATPTTAGNERTATLPPPAAATTPRPSLTPVSLLLPDAAALQGARITLWHPWGGSEDVVLRQLVDEFNNTNLWGIEASVVMHGGDEMLEANLQAASAGKGPNLIASPSSLLGAYQSKLKNLVDLAPYSDDPQWGFSEAELKDFQPAFYAQDVVAGARLGVPAWRDAPFIYYNLTWAKELGYPTPPATPYDLRVQACAAAEANLKDSDKKNNGTGGWFVATDGLTMLSWFTAFNKPGTFGNDGGYVFDTPSNRGALVFLRTLFDHNCAWTGRSTTPYNYFATRSALFYSGSLRDISTQSHIQQQKKNLDDWILIPYPSTDGKPVILADGYSYAVLNSTPAEQMAAWLLIRWLEIPRNQATLAATAGAMPASTSALEAMSDYRRLNPIFDSAVNHFSQAEAAPSFAEWRTMRPILQDAGWQLFQPTFPLENISMLLKELDVTIQMVLKQNG